MSAGVLPILTFITPHNSQTFGHLIGMPRDQMKRDLKRKSNKMVFEKGTSSFIPFGVETIGPFPDSMDFIDQPRLVPFKKF